MPSPKIRYERLEPADLDKSNEDSPSCGDESDRCANTRCRGDLARLRKRTRLAHYGNLILTLLLILTSSVAISNRPSPSHRECAKKLSPYSPLWHAVEFWEGNFVNFFNHSSIYRGPPTLQREKAWEGLWRQHLVAVDTAGIEALNQTNAGEHVEVIGSDPANPSYGATLEVFHQLHCLDELRKYTWPLRLFDKSWGRLYPSIREDEMMSRMHVDHCIETLRLSLMCYSDITPVLFLKDESRPTGDRVDFNVHHKCRDFQKIVHFQELNGHEVFTPGM
ncbi:hypothetical protein EsDP_00001789 [Epichloe bromicola]|uniref:Cyclochlorotine biosynthesis protein O n=1 Tax=Epichloe bromicola TaxID=79588 RepID=A0ABQ0CIV6_9HYPO